MSHVGGLHSIKAALKHEGKVLDLWVDASRRDRRIRELIDLAVSAGLQPVKVSRETLDKMLPDSNHQGVVANIEGIAAVDETQLIQMLAQLQEPAFVLVLDGVQDPHNLGACLRSADAAGAHAVIAPRDRSVGLTPVAMKVACGAAEHVPFVQVTNLARFLKRLGTAQGIWNIGLAGEATHRLYDADLTGPLALVLGGEGDGLRRLTREGCDQLVALPMSGQVESLNVSVAAGIALFEAVRQRSLK
jgi:23S rRNA (guanosine2251-2'-O)-methyltransferase